MNRKLILDTSEKLEEALENAKIVEREKHYRHNAEHRTFVFSQDGSLWRGAYTSWEDGGPGFEPVKCSEVEECEKVTIDYRLKERL